MGTTTCAEVNRRAVFLLQDSGVAKDVAAKAGAAFAAAPGAQVVPSTLSNVRWTEEEILLWISDSQTAITQLRPNSYNWVANVPLVPGVRQKLPTDGWVLLTANANVDPTSLEYGRAVTLATFDQFNRQFPNWRADAKHKVAYNYLYDLTDQKAFYVWPPNDGTGMVEINYSRMPSAMTSMTQPITLDDVFVPSIVAYVCMQASMKDAEFGPGLQYAAYFKGQFQELLFGKDSAEKEQNPDAGLPNPPSAR